MTFLHRPLNGNTITYTQRAIITDVLGVPGDPDSITETLVGEKATLYLVDEVVVGPQLGGRAVVRRDERREAGAAVCARPVVHHPGQMREGAVRTRGMVAPALAREVRRELHEAGAAPW